MMHRLRLILGVCLILLAQGGACFAQEIDLSSSQLEGYIRTYHADHSAIKRVYAVPLSKQRDAQLSKHYAHWLGLLKGIDFGKLSQTERIDYLLLRNKITYHRDQHQNQMVADREISKRLTFGQLVVELEEARLLRKGIEGAAAAKQLKAILDAVNKAHQGYRIKGSRAERFVDFNASRTLGQLTRALGNWHTFHSKYDPGFTWWTGDLYRQVSRAMSQYQKALAAGIHQGGDRSLVGNPIGRAALLAELKYEMIDYSPEELITIAEKDYAWCLAQMKKASAQMGFGDDWKQAMNRVKENFPKPGKQDEFIKAEALRAIKFVEDRDLVTVPERCKAYWRMRMISEQGQRIHPFFTGGEVVRIAYPTDTMSYDQKMMVFRGNNKHFSRAVVHHELIPGHHLQDYYEQRYKTYRRTFSTPFYVEGWALHWELLLWDLEYAKSPEDKIGLLFWRMHRCARIITTLNFHLGKMTPRQMIEFIVDKVGHEVSGATSEVRRFIGGGYGPLYQCAYLLGGMQIRSLHQELVINGTMSNRQFHDTILKENTVPIRMIRAVLKDEKLEASGATPWRFMDK